MWTQKDALLLVQDIYEYFMADEFGVYPALTGGLCYKHGDRKDCDIVLYMNRQKALIPQKDVIKDLEGLPGLRFIRNCGFVTKWAYNDKPVDIMFPEWYTSGDDGYAIARD